jgi:hypothetical protein
LGIVLATVTPEHSTVPQTAEVFKAREATMSIGDKLRAIDEHAGVPAPGNTASQKEPAEGPRETAGSGITNRGPDEEQQNQNRVPRRGKTKEKGNA